MAIKLDLTPNRAMEILRDDIVENLGYDGVKAVINYYEELGEDVDYDISLFWCFHRYDNAVEACKDLSIEVDKEDFDGEPLDEEAYEEACLDELRASMAVVIVLDDDSILVQDC